MARFTEADLELFAAASWDCNPLHMSAYYARRTQFGQQVVFGVLSALAVMARMRVPAGERVESLTLEFARPAFLDTDYQVVDGAFMDGSSTLAKVNLVTAPGELPQFEMSGGEVRAFAASLDDGELVVGAERSGSYHPDAAAARALWERLELDPKPWGPAVLASLLWSSYLAGMELPGERALYSRLAIRFESAGGDGPLEWQARVRSRNALNLLRIEFNLRSAGQRVASGELGVLLRPLLIEASRDTFIRSTELAGKTALVTGASRGLGAAITRALAFRGARVLVNFQQRRAEAEALGSSLPQGSVELVQGDAADPEWSRGVRDRYPQIDYLILNACPTVLPMRFEAETVDRVNAYIAKALGLVSVPLAALGGAVKERVVLISSVYVETSPKEFPHYVAAKAAAEGLIHSVARQNRKVAYLIVRPPKLMTDMTNTAYGTADALAPEVVASRLIDRLVAEHAPGTVEIL